MSDQLSGRTPVPVADPAQGYGLAVDAALVQLRAAVEIARQNGVELTADQDRMARSILTP